MRKFKINKNYTQIKNGVREIIIDKFGADDDFDNNASLIDDLGMDSLDGIEIIMELEKEFNIAIPDDDIDKLVDKHKIDSINHIVNYLCPLKDERKKKLEKIKIIYD